MLGAVTPMLNKINTYTKSNSDISGKDIDISIRIEHWGDWIVILEPCLNRVAIGLSNQISITRVLSYCKEYEIIDIGSKRDITNDFFNGFNALNIKKQRNNDWLSEKFVLIFEDVNKQLGDSFSYENSLFSSGNLKKLGLRQRIY